MFVVLDGTLMLHTGARRARAVGLRQPGAGRIRPRHHQARGQYTGDGQWEAVVPPEPRMARTLEMAMKSTTTLIFNTMGTVESTRLRAFSSESHDATFLCR